MTISIAKLLTRPRPDNLFRETGYVVGGVGKRIVDRDKINFYLYPAVRKCVGDKYSQTYNEHFLNVLSDQAIRHVIHRITNIRGKENIGNSGPNVTYDSIANDYTYLRDQMNDCGFDLDGTYDGIIKEAQYIAFIVIRDFELNGNDKQIEIYGQDP